MSSNWLTFYVQKGWNKGGTYYLSDKYMAMINVFTKTAAIAAYALMPTGCVGVLPFAMDSGEPSSDNPPTPEVRPCPAAPDFTETSDKGDDPRLEDVVSDLGKKLAGGKVGN